MAKKRFVSPFVLLSAPGDDVVIGGGSGQSGQEAWLCEYEDWLTMFQGEYDGKDGISFDDYAIWFVTVMHGTLEDWIACGNDESTYPENPGTGDDGNALIQLFPGL